jgi:hypothetical protein
MKVTNSHHVQLARAHWRISFWGFARPTCCLFGTFRASLAHCEFNDTRSTCAASRRRWRCLPWIYIIFSLSCPHVFASALVNLWPLLADMSSTNRVSTPGCWSIAPALCARWTSLSSMDIMWVLRTELFCTCWLNWRVVWHIQKSAWICNNESLIRLQFKCQK